MSSLSPSDSTLLPWDLFCQPQDVEQHMRPGSEHENQQPANPQNSQRANSGVDDLLMSWQSTGLLSPPKVNHFPEPPYLDAMDLFPWPPTATHFPPPFTLQPAPTGPPKHTPQPTRTASPTPSHPATATKSPTHLHTATTTQWADSWELLAPTLTSSPVNLPTATPAQHAESLTLFAPTHPSSPTPSLTATPTRYADDGLDFLATESVRRSSKPRQCKRATFRASCIPPDSDGDSDWQQEQEREKPAKKRRVGRPLVYGGDPNGPRLTEEERRKYKRCSANRESARRMRLKKALEIDALQAELKHSQDRQEAMHTHVRGVQERFTLLSQKLQITESQLQAAQEAQARIRSMQLEGEPHAHTQPEEFMHKAEGEIKGVRSVAEGDDRTT